MFDKAKYWENRKAGKRGQEEKELLRVSHRTGIKGALTRAQDRRRLIDRTKTKKGYVYGVKIDSHIFKRLERTKKAFAKEHKGERIPSEESRIHAERYPVTSTENNRQRMARQKGERDAKKAASRTKGTTV